MRLDAGHVLFISPQVLARMLQATGFRVERAEVFSFRPAFKALVGWARQAAQDQTGEDGVGQRPVTGGVGAAARGARFQGHDALARLREWRFHRPSVPAWLPLGLRQWVIARKQ